MRQPDPDDAAAFGAMWSEVERHRTVARVAERGGLVRAAALLDLDGHVNCREHPAIRVAPLADGADLDRDVGPLIDELVSVAADRDAAAVLITWDPMDTRGLKLLEGRRFRPTGDMPYFERAGGHVEYVSGYMDATGSTLDLIRIL